MECPQAAAVSSLSVSDGCFRSIHTGNRCTLPVPWSLRVLACSQRKSQMTLCGWDIILWSVDTIGQLYISRYVWVSKSFYWHISCPAKVLSFLHRTCELSSLCSWEWLYVLQLDASLWTTVFLSNWMPWWLIGFCGLFSNSYELCWPKVSVAVISFLYFSFPHKRLILHCSKVVESCMRLITNYTWSTLFLQTWTGNSSSFGTTWIETTR